VVIVMGIPGAGKSRVAEAFAARGYVRLNRDERGGSLRDLATVLDDELASGARRIVLDNTYLTRSTRSHVVDTAHRYGSSVRCIWCDTPLAQAQVNLVERILERFGSLPAPEELRALARREPGLLTERRRGGVFVAAGAVTRPGWDAALAESDPGVPHLVLDWNPAGTADALLAGVDRLSSAVSGVVEGALCPHAAGPPVCWCRPPLPGLPLAFARAHEVDPLRSTLIGTGPAHRTLAATLGCRYIPV
jgi:predicted kinase